jgi:hypothetical protein
MRRKLERWYETTSANLAFH